MPVEIRGHFAGIILLFIVSSGDETRVLRLGGKRLYLGAISPAHTHEVLFFPASLETMNRCLALCTVARCTADDVRNFPIFFFSEHILKVEHFYYKLVLFFSKFNILLTHTYIYTYTHACIHTCTHIYTHLHKYTQTHT